MQRERKTKTVLKCIQLARVVRKDRKFVGKNIYRRREGGRAARERSNFWAIAGQFRRVPNVAPRSAVVFCSLPFIPIDYPDYRARPPKPMLRAILHPSFGVISFCTRAESHPLSLSLSLPVFCFWHIRSVNQLFPGRGVTGRVKDLRAGNCARKIITMITTYGREKRVAIDAIV